MLAFRERLLRGLLIVSGYWESQMWSLTIAVGYREGLNRELPIAAHGYRESNMWSLTIRAYVVVGQQE